MSNLKVSVLYFEDRAQSPPEVDEVVGEVVEALAAGGHQPLRLGVYDDLGELVNKLKEQSPDLVFNLCETFAGVDSYDLHITAVLSVLGLPYTGTGPVGMALRQDKAITKKLLAFHGVPCPNYAVFDLDNVEAAGRMHFPLFVKPLHGDASLGIDDRSLVRDYDSLVGRINRIHNELKDAALVEEYIEGREFYVGVLGNPPQALPLIEMDFSKLPIEYPHIYGRAAKFDHASIQFDRVNAVIATELEPQLRSRIIKAGLEAAYALQVRDYARVDIRLAPEGTPYVVEVNANPYLERTSAFAIAALQAGMGYNTLVNRIVDLAMSCTQTRTPLKDMACSLVAAKGRREPTPTEEPGTQRSEGAKTP